MSTAAEIMLFMEAVQPQMAQLQDWAKKTYGAILEDTMVRGMGREVGAKRMRTLQRRGAVIRFSRYTSTGKRRYKWLPAATVAWA